MAKKKNTCKQDCSSCRLYWRHDCELVQKNGGEQIYVQLSFFDFDGDKIVEKCEK